MTTHPPALSMSEKFYRHMLALTIIVSIGYLHAFVFNTKESLLIYIGYFPTPFSASLLLLLMSAVIIRMLYSYALINYYVPDRKKARTPLIAHLVLMCVISSMTMFIGLFFSVTSHYLTIEEASSLAPSAQLGAVVIIIFFAYAYAKVYARFQNKQKEQ